MVQAQLARAGITVRIRQLELSAFLDRVYGTAPDFDAAVLGTPGDLGLGYLSRSRRSPACVRRGASRRCSSSSATRCRRPSSIMRAACRG